MSSTPKNRPLQNILSFLNRPEGFFVIVAFVFGVLLLFTVPPFQTPDENVHFYRAYEISELRAPQVNKMGESGSFLPLSIRETEERVHGVYAPPGTTGHIMFNPTEKYDYRFTKSALFDIPLKKDDRIFYVTSGSPAYMPISYLPQALVVGAGRLLGLPIILMLYIVRMVNLIIWIVLAYIGIKIFPWKRWAAVGVCLLPVMAAQTISPGLDVSVMGGFLIFIAIIFRAIAEDKYSLKRRHIVLLLITSIVMVFGKSVFALLLPLVLLVKDKQITIKHSFWTKLGVIIVPMVLYIIWVIASNGSGSAVDQSSGAAQINSLLHSPWLFFRSMINTIFFITPSGNILSQSIIGSFGWLDTPLSPPFVIIGYVYLTLILLVNYETPNRCKGISKNTRIMISIIGALYAIAVFLAMYIYFTPVTGNHVMGVNGRYLVPLMFILVPILFSNILRVRKRLYINFVKTMSIFLLIISVLTIIFRYYYSFITQ